MIYSLSMPAKDIKIASALVAFSGMYNTSWDNESSTEVECTSGAGTLKASSKLNVKQGEEH
jgi:hypothetical protein